MFVTNTKIFSVDRVTKAMCLYSTSTHFQEQMKIFFSFRGLLSTFIKTPLVKVLRCLMHGRAERHLH